ncbi:MAG: hypothetical protein KGN76_04050 [Acidobacteriota bacterium]|nr:hypothetical protein [Acidobacteriota bacterium]
MRRLLSIAEVADLVSHVEQQPCSTRQVRYLLVTAGLGTDPGRRRNGQTRLYDLLDVAMVRMAVRLRQEGVSPWVIRVVLTYLRNDLIKAWRTGALVGLAISGIQGTLEPALKGRPARAIAWVPLRDIWHGLDAELRRVSETRDTLWMWREVPVKNIPNPYV